MRSRRLTKKEQRNAVADHMADNPSLKPKTEEAMTIAYRGAIVKAAKDTSIDEVGFWSACPWLFD